MELSIIIPVKDEADSIVPLLEEVRVALAGETGWEVLVVDDGSGDETAARVDALAAAGYTGLRLLRHGSSCGQSAALARAPCMPAAHGLVPSTATARTTPCRTPAAA